MNIIFQIIFNRYMKKLIFFQLFFSCCHRLVVSEAMSNCHICRNIFSTYVGTCFQFCHISCIYFVQLISVCNRCESIDRTGVSYGHQLCTKDDYINNGHFIIIYCFPVCFV